MTQYHEPVDQLDDETRNMTRALMSLKEEVEAVDWYNQRAAVCTDPELRKVLEHNRDEEIEHACMTLEWLRRNMDGWDEELRTYLFTKVGITEAEEAAEGGEGEAGETRITGKGLGIGNLK